MNRKLYSFISIVYLFFSVCSTSTRAQSIVINEVSQGTGSAEYVEMIVTGSPSCDPNADCMDLRGYIIDDNNGYFASGTGTGIASGAVRFSNNSMWSCVPVGTIILIYNDTDQNSSLPANDLSLTDGNCVLVIPINSTLFESVATTPNSSDPSYPGSGWVPGGNWAPISMANTDDSFQIRTPGGGSVLFSVSWGNNINNNMVYFSGSASGLVFYNADDLSTWSSGIVPNDETPGAPNTTANADWISSMNNNCSPILSLTQNSSNASCNNTCDGTASVTATGGSTPYTYDWSSGQSTASVSNLCAGNYTVTVTDNIGCTKTASFVITEPSAINANSSSTNTSCGQSNGQACVNPSGGNNPYTYVWDNAQTSSCINSIAAGTYDVTITDDDGCTQTESVVVTNQGANINGHPSSTASSCGQSNGQACVAPTGGATPYTYLWDNAQTTACISNLAAGTYDVTITDDNGCTHNESVVVTNQGANINGNPSSTASSCGQSNGQACVAPTGGATPYTYLWDNGQTTACISNLAAGTYDVTITDDNGCTENESIVVTNQGANINGHPSSTASSCGQSNGQACVAPSGGATPYTYLWDNGQTTACISNLAAGTYDVTITDDNGCTENESIVVTNQGANINGHPSSTASSCGQSNGQACVAPSGGATPYTYLWDNTQTTACINNVAAGTYDVTITDNNGCTQTESVVVTNQGANINGNPSSTASSCGQSNGQACVAPTGGATPYTYLWDNGQTTACISNLAAGTYDVTITDDNGCTQNESVVVTNQGANINGNPSSTASSCGQSNGQACVAPSGGATPYTYLWDNAQTTACINNVAAGTYDVTITDNNGCTQTESVVVTNQGANINGNPSSTASSCGQSNGQACVAPSGGATPYTYLWDNAQTTACISNLAAGTYDVTITDNNGCTQNESIVVTNQGANINGNPSSTASSCGQSNGQACVAPSGGATPYTYLWDNAQTTACISNVAAGTYDVTITDNNGCTKIESVIVSSPNNFQATYTHSDESCLGMCDGSIQINATGGINPLEYSINNGLNFGANNTFNSLCAGSYPIQVRDATGCLLTSSINITNGGSTSVPVITPIGSLCISSPNTLLQADIPGGIWMGNGIVNAITGEFSPSQAGLGSDTVWYYVSGNKCSDTANTVITVSNQIQITSSNLRVCEDTGLVTLQASPSGGIWQGPGISNSTLGEVDVQLLSPGQYNYTYYFNQVCGDTATIRLDVLTDQTITLSIDDSICVDEGLIHLDSPYAGGIWFGNGITGNTLYTFNPQVAGVGIHELYYVNTNLCQQNDTAYVDVLGLPSSIITVNELQGCVPFTITLNQSNSALSDVKWYLNNILISTDLNTTYTITTPGTYSISSTISESGLCEQTVSFPELVEVLGDPIASFEAMPIENTYQFEFYSTTEDVSYFWSVNKTPFYTTPFNYDFRDTGSFDVCLYVENKFGCTDTTCQIIDVKNPYFNVYIPNTFTPDGDDKNETFFPTLTDLNVIHYQFNIFNRWGQVVFSTEEPFKAWNGLYLKEAAKSDIYVWKLEFIQPETNTHFSKTGQVLLLR